MVRRLSLLLGVLGFSACEPSVSIEAFCRDLSKAQCEASKRCGTLSTSVDCGIPNPSFDCLAPYRAAYEAKTLRFDPVMAFKCVEDSRNDTTCSTNIGSTLPESCFDVSAGNAKEGEVCGQCAAGLRCVSMSTDACGGICTKVTPQGQKLPKRGEPCTSPVVDGAGCEIDSWCDAQVCVARAAVGERCGANQCVVSANCVEGTCVAKPEVGDACDAQACNMGLACIDGVCVTRLGVGVACSVNDQCVSQLCIDGSCSVGRAEKSPCDDVAVCQPGLHCVNSKCEALPGHGGACDGVCAGFGRCIDGTCFDATLQVCG